MRLAGSQSSRGAKSISQCVHIYTETGTRKNHLYGVANRSFNPPRVIPLVSVPATCTVLQQQVVRIAICDSQRVLAKSTVASARDGRPPTRCSFNWYCAESRKSCLVNSAAHARRLSRRLVRRVNAFVAFALTCTSSAMHDVC
jgi:hypothetical protein